MFKLLLLCSVIFHNGAAWNYQPWYTGGSSGHYRQVTPSVPVLGTQYHQRYPYFPWNKHPAPVPFLPILPVVLMPMVPLPFKSWGQMYNHTMKPYFPWLFHHGYYHHNYKKIDCVPDDCPMPVIQNGTVLVETTVNGTTVTGGNATVGSNATITCDTGFILQGPETITCTENSTWSNKIPSCKLCNHCPPLSAPMNGSVSPNATVVGTTVTYECDDGFVIVGSNTRTCSDNCVWTGSEPTCKCNECPPLTAPTSGSVSPNATAVGTTVTYECDDGFVIVGSDTRNCSDNCVWTGSEPTCKCNECPPLTAPASGSVSPNATVVGTTVTYECDDGFVIVGSDTRNCSDNCVWTGREPTCTCNMCPQPGEIDNGTLTSNASNVVGDTITYSCDNGFSLNGSATVTCLSNCAWGPYPNCVRNVCDKPSIQNGSIADSGFENGVPVEGSTVKFKCDAGFTLFGPVNITCTNNGSWNMDFPLCKPDCSIPSINHGTVDGKSAVGSSITLSCNTGYILCGNKTLTCNENSIWDHPIPICVYQYNPRSTVAQFGGHTYVFSHDAKMWGAAQATCASYCNCDGDCGHLVTINSVDEQLFLGTNGKQIDQNDEWYIGLRGNGTVWQWVTQENFDLDYFLRVNGQIPSPLTSHCGLLLNSVNNYRWYIAVCHIFANRYICEIP